MGFINPVKQNRDSLSAIMITHNHHWLGIDPTAMLTINSDKAFYEQLALLYILSIDVLISIWTLCNSTHA